MKDVHNLGVFDTLEEVWDLYPYGGCPGDYVIIKGEIICWNDEDRVWGIYGLPDIKNTIGRLTNVADDADLTSETDDVLIRLAGERDWSVDTTLLSQVSQLMTNVFPFIISFNGGGTYEKGQILTPQISWIIERKDESVFPSAATVNGSVEGISSDFKSFTGKPITEDVSYYVKVQCDNQMLEGYVSYFFKFMKYWGVSDKTILSSADVLGMNHSFATSKEMGKTTFDCTGGKYPYYILPEEFDGIEVWINGFRNTDLDISYLEVTNDYNVSKNYKVVRLNTIQTGVLTIEYK